MAPTFSGPLTVAAITDWFDDCELGFATTDASKPKKMTEEQKILEAGGAISGSSAETKSLHTWFARDRQSIQKKKWAEFQDLFKEEALGKGWEIKILHDFYKFQQGSASFNDYLTQFKSLKNNISRTGSLSAKFAITDKAFLCHVLFGSKAGLVDHFLKHHNNVQELIDYDTDKIKSILNDYERKINSIASTVPTGDMASSGVFILSPAYGPGGKYGNPFSDLYPNNLAWRSNAVPHISSITIYANQDSTAPVIGGYEIVSVDGVKKNPPTITYGSDSKSMDLSAGQYISQIQLSWRKDTWAVGFLKVTSSTNVSISVGHSSGEVNTFNAPDGWRIVGFYGMADYNWNNRYVIPSFGAICAPVLKLET